MAGAETESGSSSGGILKEALILPFYPRKSFSVLRKNQNLKIAATLVVAFSVVYSLSRVSTSETFDHDDEVQVAVHFLFFFVSSILGFLLLVLFSNILMRGLSRARSKYSVFANLLAYFFAWKSTFSSILVVLNPSGEVLFNPFSWSEMVLLVVALVVFAWSLWLVAVAYSVE